MVKNINTTIDKIALSEFDTHYEYLGENEKQWCHDEMVNNPKWLKPSWKKDIEKYPILKKINNSNVYW